MKLGKKQTYTELEPLIVTWHDASATSLGWGHKHTYREGYITKYIINTAGFFLEESNGSLHVVMQHGVDNGLLDQVMSIPLGMVIKVQRFLPEEKKKPVRKKQAGRARGNYGKALW